LIGPAIHQAAEDGVWMLIFLGGAGNGHVVLVRVGFSDVSRQDLKGESLMPSKK